MSRRPSPEHVERYGPLLSTTEAAAKLGVQIGTLHQWSSLRRADRPRPVRLMGKLWWPERDLDRMLTEDGGHADA